MAKHPHDSVTDQGQESKYFHIMLNMADDDLNPYQYRLLGHYRRVCGAGKGGHCWEAVRTTAKKTRMSLTKVISTRKELTDLRYIEVVEPGDQAHSTVIILKDKMLENIQRYAVECSPHEQGVPNMEQGVPNMEQGVPNMEHKKNSLRITNEEDTNTGAGAPDVQIDTFTSLIKAWLDALPAQPVFTVSPYKNKTTRALAEEMSRRGVTAAQVVEYVSALVSQPYWTGRTIGLEYVAANIPAWLEAGRKTGVAAKSVRADANGGYDLEKEQREQMARNAAMGIGVIKTKGE